MCFPPRGTTIPRSSQPMAQTVEIDSFSSGLHVEDTLDEVHTLVVLQDMSRKILMECVRIIRGYRKVLFLLY